MSEHTEKLAKARRQFAIASHRAIDSMMHLGVLAICVGSLVGLMGFSHWGIDLLNHMRSHFVVAGVVGVAWMVWQGNRKWFLLGFACLIFNAAIVRPWHWLPLGHATNQNTVDKLRVVSWNTLWTHPDNASIASQLTSMDADVIVLVEYTLALSQCMDALRQSHPYVREIPGERAFGVAVFSRHPCRFQTYVLASGNVPCIEAKLTTPGVGEVQIWAIHLFPPMGEMWNYRERQMRELAALIQGTATTHAIVCGDFNDTPWSRTFTKFLDRTKLQDSRIGFGYQASWPTRLGMLGIPIDHVLLSPSITATDRRVRFASNDSDHAAIITDIRIPSALAQ